MSRKLAFLTLCLWLTAITFPVFAQQKTETTHTFRFVSQKDMFFVPYKDNGEELSRLLECVEQLKEGILAGEIPVRVDGYCNSWNSVAENLAMAKIRSNRVKSELIVRKGLKEECFRTRNHATEGNFVTVCIVVPAKETAVTEAEKCCTEECCSEECCSEECCAEECCAEGCCAEECCAEKCCTEGCCAEKCAMCAEKYAETCPEMCGGQCDEECAKWASQQGKAAEEGRPAAEQAAAESMAESVSPVEEKTSTANYNFSLRANLLRWVTLTPDLGIEWRVSPTVGILVNGSWTVWTWNDNHRRYGLWEVMPELRFYLGERKAWYMGAMFKTGHFNYNLTDNGKQGDLIGGGLTCGYQLRLSKALSMDFGLALGYLQAEYERYEVTNGVPECVEEGTQNWWGPINAGITLVWKLF